MNRMADMVAAAPYIRNGRGYHTVRPLNEKFLLFLRFVTIKIKLLPMLESREI